MVQRRVIPVLLLQKGALVKSIRFKKFTYVGDPINAVKIFNDKEVDEIIILDISATKEKRPPNIDQVAEIASEAFMPLGYGGGITSLKEIQKILYGGAEKVILNTVIFHQPELLTEAARQFGSQSIVASIDVKKNFWGKYQVYVHCGSYNTKKDPVAYAKEMEERGAGEIFINSIDQDGTFKGYDLELIKMVADAVEVPVVACGGAAGLDDFQQAIQVGSASAVAAGSFFIFQQPHRAVLISYPSREVILQIGQ